MKVKVCAQGAVCCASNQVLNGVMIVWNERARIWLYLVEHPKSGTAYNYNSVSEPSSNQSFPLYNTFLLTPRYVGPVELAVCDDLQLISVVLADYIQHVWYFCLLQLFERKGQFVISIFHVALAMQYVYWCMLSRNVRIGRDEAGIP
jgi:hypothetical protein